MLKTIIVAGLPRSGTSLMMQILQKGGYPCFGTYPGFEDLEYGKLVIHPGKAQKVLDPIEQKAPTGDFHVIVMRRRDRKEQAKSHFKLLTTMFSIEPERKELRKYERYLEKDEMKVFSWAKGQKDCLVVFFEDVLANPESEVKKISEYFDLKLTPEASSAVVKRSPKCYDGFLENELLKGINEKGNVITTTHNLDFESAPWHHNPCVNVFRVGTCHGQWYSDGKSYNILSIINEKPGNGHTKDVFEWFENSCRREDVPLHVLEVMNDTFRETLIKHGYSQIPNTDNFIKLFT